MTDRSDKVKDYLDEETMEDISFELRDIDIGDISEMSMDALRQILEERADGATAHLDQVVRNDSLTKYPSVQEDYRRATYAYDVFMEVYHTKYEGRSEMEDVDQYQPQERSLKTQDQDG